MSTRIFVVSLAQSSRRATFTERARDSGLEWAFFDASEGLAPGLDYREAEARLHYGRPLNPGELGCYSSHYRLWQRLLEDDAEQYVILEDDVIADWAMLNMIAGTDFAASGALYLRLYYKRPGPYVVRKRAFLHRNCHLLELFGPAWGTQGYVITRPAAERLVRFCRKVVRPVDDQLDRFWEHGIPNLCLFPFPIVEEARPSTIGNARFVAAQSSVKRKALLLRELAARRLAMLRRRRHRQEWRAVRFDDGSRTAVSGT